MTYGKPYLSKCVQLLYAGRILFVFLRTVFEEFVDEDVSDCRDCRRRNDRRNLRIRLTQSENAGRIARRIWLV